MWRSRLFVFASLFVARSAFAQRDLDVRADHVDVDARLRELDLKGNVHADAPPFHLSADTLHLRRSSRGVEVEGDGQLAFCPCLGTPLTVSFKGATVAPPGDLLLTSPVLRIFGIPVFWLPFFWLRAPSRLGLLPPIISYRAQDGWFFGGGVHAPWRTGDVENGLDLRAGGYTKGGFGVEAILKTPVSRTRAKIDYLPPDSGAPNADTGMELDSRGRVSNGSEALAWDADAIRGSRGVLATTDLEPAARVWDRAKLEASILAPSYDVSLSAIGTARRGGIAFDAQLIGAMASFGLQGSAGGLLTWDAIIDGGGFVTESTPLSLARIDAGARFATHAHALSIVIAARGAGDLVAQSTVAGGDGGGSARATIGIPLARRFGTEPDAWVHRLEPLVSVSTFATAGDRLLGMLPGRGMGAVDGTALTSDLGIDSVLGRYSQRDLLTLSLRGGGIVKWDKGTRPVVRWRAQMNDPNFMLGAEGAHVIGLDETVAELQTGNAVTVRTRLGRLDGVAAQAWVTALDGVDPIAARALFTTAEEAPLGFLQTTGVSAGGRLSLPFGRHVTLRGGADGDLTQKVFTAAIASIELRDGCGCFRFRVTGQNRLGRDGVDVFFTIDLAPRASYL